MTYTISVSIAASLGLVYSSILGLHGETARYKAKTLIETVPQAPTWSYISYRPNGRTSDLDKFSFAALFLNSLLLHRSCPLSIPGLSQCSDAGLIELTLRPAS